MRARATTIKGDESMLGEMMIWYTMKQLRCGNSSGFTKVVLTWTLLINSYCELITSEVLVSYDKLDKLVCNMSTYVRECPSMCIERSSRLIP